jgi:hypothetical protein
VAKKRVLAVDDDESVVEYYQQSLPQIGFEVSCAT